ncbi:MAG: hypothetical protein QXR87_07765, partial [Candidatus Hadarchaeales archaeon]
NSPPNPPVDLMADGTAPPSSATSRPTFTWTHSDNNEETQRAYRLQVASVSPDNIIWDTGKTVTPLSNYQYAGPSLSSGLTYYWRVKTWDQDDAEGAWSDWAPFTVNSPPSASVVSPVSLALAPAAPVFTWSFSDGNPGDSQTGWRIQVDEYPADWSNLIWDSGQQSGSSPSVTYSGPPLVRGRKYSWRVMVRDRLEWSEWSGEGSFTVNALPVCSGLLVNGQVNPQMLPTTTPIFSWTFSDSDGQGQAGYQVWIGTTPGTKNVWDSGEIFSSSTETSYAGPGLQRGKTYYWRVRVWDGLEWGEWSEGTFRLNSLPVASDPRVNGKVNPSKVSLPITFSWAFSDDEDSAQTAYRIQVGRVPGAGDVWDSGDVSSSSTSATYGGPALEKGRLYYWRVRVRDNLEWGEWADGIFTTNHPPVLSYLSPSLVLGKYTGSENVRVYLTASDQDGSVENVQVSLDNFNWSILPYSNEITVTLPPREGVPLQVLVRVVDDSGEPSSPLSFQVILDKTPPLGMVPLSPSNGAVVGPENIRLCWYPPTDNVSGVKAEYTVEVGAKPDLSDAVSTTTQYCYLVLEYKGQKGDRYWRVRVKDMVGNEAVTQTFRMRYDPNAPTGGLRETREYFSSTTLTLSLTGNPYEFRYSLAGTGGLEQEEWRKYTGPFSLPLDREGEYLLTYELRSAAGVTAGPFTYRFVADWSPPILELGRSEVYTRENQCLVQVMGFDAVSGVERMRVWREGENSEWTEYSPEITLPLPEEEGAYEFYLQLVDKAGNLSAVRTLTVIVDRTPPAIEVENLPTVVRGRRVTLRGRVEPGSILVVNGKAVPVSSDGTFLVSVSVSEGRNEITLYARDPAGNEREEVVTVLAEAPPPSALPPVLAAVAVLGLLAAAVAAKVRRGPSPLKRMEKEVEALRKEEEKKRKVKVRAPPTPEEILREAEERARKRK